jgi:catechol 2,3-dioxygenase-like lactoylglutathione lyase family enzyme
MKKLTEIARFTDNLEAMTAFYKRLLGAEPAAQSEGMSIFMIGETKLFLHRTYTPAEGELPPENHLAFTVPNVDQACTELTSAGLEIEIPPKEYYWGYSAYLRDPDGGMIELIQTEVTSPDKGLA